MAIYQHTADFTLESGKVIPGYHLAYQTWGTLNAQKSNAVWVFHALTANADATDWWSGLVGEGKLFDPAQYFIVCVNMPGSHYGSISPLDREDWYANFPWFTVQDMVRAYQPLRKALGIEKIHIGIGGSMGGQQLLEWAVAEPALFEYIIPIATNAQHSSWGIAFNESQRWAIENDPTWQQTNPQAGIEGMKLARSVALISYRNYTTYTTFQPTSNDDPFTQQRDAASYQRYQGEKLAQRFNAYSYYFLSKGMDSQHVGRNRGGVRKALSSIQAKALCVGISSDILFPPSEQRILARWIPDATYEEIHSVYGHDGFLLEYEQLEIIIRNYLKKTFIPNDLETEIFN